MLRGPGGRVHALNAIAYVEAALERGLRIDEFAPRLAFFFNCHNNVFQEIAKFRAVRRMSARIVRERFGSTDERSQMIRFHTQTGGVTLQAQQPEVNIIRVALQGFAAALLPGELTGYRPPTCPRSSPSEGRSTSTSGRRSSSTESHPKFQRLLDHVDGRLALVPRFRQRVTPTPLNLSNPEWTDDARFDLSWHVRRVALPAPGGPAELRGLVGRVMSVAARPEPAALAALPGRGARRRPARVRQQDPPRARRRRRRGRRRDRDPRTRAPRGARSSFRPSAPSPTSRAPRCSSSAQHRTGSAPLCGSRGRRRARRWGCRGRPRGE